MAMVLEEGQVESTESYERLVQTERIVRESPVEEESPEYEIIFPLDDGHVSPKAFEFVIQIARRFSGNLVLVYVTQPSSVPPEFLNYAKSERIRDYEWQYYNSLASGKLGSLGRKAEKAGLKWKGSLYLGAIKDVLKSYGDKENAIVVLNDSLSDAKRLRKLTPKTSVPILLI